MYSGAKGSFPGRPQKKIQKQKAKFQPALYKNDLEDLKVTCSFITHITHQFERIFDDGTSQEQNFLGFKGKKKKTKDTSAKLSKIKTIPSKESSDNVAVKWHTLSPNHDAHGAGNVQDNVDSSFGSPLRKDSEPSGSSSDSAFLRYKNSKLDFHRLSRKARSRDVYEGYTAEEQANRKDTSVASLKYASNIYLAKDHSSSNPKSPIKPATFIPPRSSKHMHVSKHGATGLVIKTGKASEDSSKPTKSKTTRSFVLPTKSARSSRIIKANRKYLNEDSNSSGIMDLSQSPVPPASPALPSPCSVKLPPFMFDHRQVQLENMKVRKKLGENYTKQNSTKRRPLIKEPTFQVGDPVPRETTFQRRKNVAHARVQRLIKRAKFKHSEVSIQEKKKLIKDATFTAPLSESTASDEASNANSSRRRRISPQKEISDFGLSTADWNTLTQVPTVKNDSIPTWTRQEVHNVLHGAHTFGAAWGSITRQYDFHEQHRDWWSVRNKGVKCRNMGLLSATFKVKSSVLLQLKPKLSDNPNVTVFTPNELRQRGLTRNVTCDMSGGSVADQGGTEVATSDDASRRNKLASPGGKSSSVDDVYLGLSQKCFDSLTRSCKPKWSTWEIHSLLHGVHSFGVGQWPKILQMYRFRKSHDCLALRAKFKSLNNRGLVVGGAVRSDIIPNLRPVLTSDGSQHFAKLRTKVIQHHPRKRKANIHDVTNVQGSSPDKRVAQKQRGRPKSKIKQPTLDDSDDSLNISPPRKQAYHLFGTTPVWDDANQPDLMDIKSSHTSTPVMQALEDGLRRNSSSSNDFLPSPAGKRTQNSQEAASTSPPTPQSPASPKPGKPNVKAGKATGKKGQQTEQQTPAVPGKGPRIKHVCRRASLVTGQVKATYDDCSPQLSALPKDEREKIAAEAEKQKDKPPQFSTSESEDEPRAVHKGAPNSSAASSHVTHVARKDKVGGARKRHSAAATPCGKCEACVAPPCGECDGCRSQSAENQPATSPVLSPKCLRRNSCTQPLEGVTYAQAKRAKKAAPEQQEGSRKSSRLRQQKVPLFSSNISDPSVGSRDSSTLPASNVPLKISRLAAPAVDDPAFRSSSKYTGLYPEVFSPLKQAIVKLDNWKETYDLAKLWKSGGHALITSQPAPPRVVCFLCGSLGSSDNRVRGPVVYCACCCEPFHAFCVDESQQRMLSAVATNTWVCKRCRYCHVCGHTKNLLECRHCHKTYHSECLGPSYPTKPSESGAWVCMRCVRCQSCGASKPGNLAGAKWTHDFTMCQRCGDLYDKGNFCPICQRCYSDEDFDTRMVQCASCKRWVHSKCESLTVEMYTLLSHLPDNIQYKCPDCDDRGVRMQEIMNEEDEKKLARSPGAMTQGNTPDAERVRRILSQLPAPRWRTVIEEEIQAGLEEITMSLFHNRAMYCILKRDSNADDSSSSLSPRVYEDTTKRPHDLFAVRFAVHNRRYRSLNDFYSDVRAILVSVAEPEDRGAVMRAFREEAGNVFPWFNFETGRIRDTDDVPENLLPHATMPPVPEHDYAQWLDKDITRTPGTPFASPGKSQQVPGWGTPVKGDSPAPFGSFEDLRLCIFCSKYGDDKPTDCGRLLYCGQDEWCHVNCGLWSAEVFEQHDASLQYVHSAASRGKMMKCDHCRLPGATVGCHTRDCPKNYHFMCARRSGCAFQTDKKVFCARHLQHVKAEVLSDEQFAVPRLVCVDNDEMRPNRRWQRGMHAAAITLTVGSLTVHSLGQLSLASDSRECLVPVSYRMTRLFWSTFSANRKTLYTITITDRKPSVDSSDADKSSETNMTISHVNESDRFQSNAKPSPARVSCKDNLVNRLDDPTPHIGPLSPIRRTPTKTNRDGQPTGTYTIMSNLNKTLPRLVTPIPATAKLVRENVTTSLVQSAPATLRNPATTSASPGNPYLRPPNILTDSDKPSAATGQWKPPELQPILYNSSLVRLSSRFAGKENQLSSSISTAQDCTLNSGSSGSIISGQNLDAKCVSTVAIKKVGGQTDIPESPTVTSIKNSEDSSIVTQKVTKSQVQPPDFSGVSKTDKPEPKSFAKFPEPLVVANASSIETADLKTTNVSEQDTSTSPFQQSDKQTSVGLLASARRATATAESKATLSSKPKEPEVVLWWKKQQKQEPGKCTRENSSKSDGDLSPPSKSGRRKYLSADHSDPSFVPERATWKRLPGESATEASTRVTRRSLDRNCKKEELAATSELANKSADLPCSLEKATAKIGVTDSTDPRVDEHASLSENTENKISANERLEANENEDHISSDEEISCIEKVSFSSEENEVSEKLTPLESKASDDTSTPKLEGAPKPELANCDDIETDSTFQEQTSSVTEVVSPGLTEQNPCEDSADTPKILNLEDRTLQNSEELSAKTSATVEPKHNVETLTANNSQLKSNSKKLRSNSKIKEGPTITKSDQAQVQKTEADLRPSPPKHCNSKHRRNKSAKTNHKTPLMRLGATRASRARSKSHDVMRTRSGKGVSSKVPSPLPLRHRTRSGIVGAKVTSPSVKPCSKEAKAEIELTPPLVEVKATPVPKPNPGRNADESTTHDSNLQMQVQVETKPVEMLVETQVESNAIGNKTKPDTVTTNAQVEGDERDDLDSPSRRYPRRDTYLCLKSFSGLSPNYALASYSRHEPQDSGKRKLRKSRKRPATTPPRSLRRASASRKISPVKLVVGRQKDAGNSSEEAGPGSARADVLSQPDLVQSSTSERGSSDRDTPPCVDGERCKDSDAFHEKEVKAALNDLLNAVVVSLSNPQPRPNPRQEDIPTRQENESSPILPDLDDSIETARGGGAPGEEAPRAAETGINFSSEILNVSVSSNTTSDFRPSESLVSPVMDLDDHLPSPVDDAMLKNDLLASGECPVLNADEVETLLESQSDPISPVQLGAYSVNSSVNNLLQPATQQQLPTDNFFNPMTQFSAPPPAVSPAINAIHKFPTFIPNSTGFVRDCYGVGEQTPNNPPSVVPRPLQIRIPFVPLPNPAPAYSEPPPLERSPIAQGPIPISAPLSYSMRVTMAMTGAFNDDSMTSHAFRYPTNVSSNLKQQYPQKQQQQSPSNPPRLPTPINVAKPVVLNTSSSLRSPPKPSKFPSQPQPQGNSDQQMNALEHMINYYSAKNNLTTEEKEIVRSIISSQIQTNQLPMPAAANTASDPLTSPDVLKPSQSFLPCETKLKQKKRKSSHEREKKDRGTRAKRKRSLDKQSHDKHHHHVAIDAPWVVHSDDGSDESSCLMEIYEQRAKCIKMHKQPALKVLSMYNIFLGDKKTNRENRLPPPPPNGTSPAANKRPYLMYEIKSDDGYSASGPDLQELMNQLFAAVQECRSTAKGGNPCLALTSVMTPHRFLGLSHDAVRFLVEQLPGARHCHRYRAKYHKHKKAKNEITHINPHGCCRAEQYKGRSKPDMFSFLASKYRIPPEFVPERHQDDDMMQLSNRRATSMEQLPMAMRFRHLRTFSREAVGVYRSSIHGRGLFCKRDVEAGEMIMEYTGEVIRRELTDKREKCYESKSIGCYMFRMDDFYVVDATMRGSSARFVNHSCEPNCYSRIVNVEGKKHIVIFALRKIFRGEELTYDYKFPIEDDSHKITCNCGARTCRKFMN